ncbi:MAG: PadR family transcriptional regulator [Candidatus Hermodarchaeota archaeon]
MSKTNPDDNNFVKWVEKEAGGSLTRLLILCIIHEANQNGTDAWGYDIQKKLRLITKSSDSVKNSSLYTILKRFKRIELVKSIKKEKRVVYTLTEKGKVSMEVGYEYWKQLVKSSILAFDSLGFEVIDFLKEEELIVEDD